MLVRGAAGMGKTSLLRTALDVLSQGVLAAMAGPVPGDLAGTVFSARCLPADRGLPLSLLGSLVPRPDGFRGPWGEPDQRAALDRIGSAQPAVVAVDDLHWADERSLEALEPWLRGIAAGRRVAVLATMRLTDIPSPLERLLAGLVGAAVLQEHVLEPLDDTATNRLARWLFRPPGEDLAGNPAPPAVPGEAVLPEGVVEQLRHTGGNPVLVRDVLRSAGETRRSPGDRGPGFEAPPDVAVPFDRGDRPDLPVLGPDAHHLIVLASMLSPRFAARDLCLAAGRTMSELLPATSELVAAGLISESGAGLSVASARLRHQLRGELPGSVRAELHRDLAQRLDEGGADAVAVAEQLLDSDVRIPDLAWVATVARRAAREDPVVGIALWQRVASTGRRGTAMWSRAVAALAEVHLAAGQLALAKAVARAALSSSRPGPGVPDTAASRTGVGDDQRLPLERVAAAALLGQGLWEVARTSAEMAADDPDLSASGRVDLLALAGLGAVLGGPTARAVETAERAERRWTMSDPSGGSPPLVALRAELHHRRGDLALALSELRSALVATGSEGERAALDLALHVRLARALADADRPDEARRLLDVADQAAQRQGATAEGQRSRLTRAEVDFVSGELSGSLVALPGDDTAETLVVGRALLLARRALVALHRQGPVAGTVWLDRVPGDLGAASRLPGLGWVFRTRAMLRLALQDESGWYDALAAGWRHCREADLHVDLAVLGVELAEAATQRHDTALADEVVAHLEELAARNRDVPWLAASARSAAGFVEGDVELLLEGVDLWRSSPRRLQAARATERAALRIRLLGWTGEADDLAAAAARGYQLAGADHDAERLRTLLRASASPSLGGPGAPSRGAPEEPATVAGWETLTPTERLVAGFVERGESNAAIAERLVVSRRTVESHVSHILGKLGVRSRAEMILAAARRAESADAEDPGRHG